MTTKELDALFAIWRKAHADGRLRLEESKAVFKMQDQPRMYVVIELPKTALVGKCREIREKRHA